MLVLNAINGLDATAVANADVEDPALKPALERVRNASPEIVRNYTKIGANSTEMGLIIKGNIFRMPVRRMQQRLDDIADADAAGKPAATTAAVEAYRVLIVFVQEFRAFPYTKTLKEMRDEVDKLVTAGLVASRATILQIPDTEDETVALQDYLAAQLQDHANAEAFFEFTKTDDSKIMFQSMKGFPLIGLLADQHFGQPRLEPSVINEKINQLVKQKAPIFFKVIKPLFPAIASYSEDVAQLFYVRYIGGMLNSDLLCNHNKGSGWSKVTGRSERIITTSIGGVKLPPEHLKQFATCLEEEMSQWDFFKNVDTKEKVEGRGSEKDYQIRNTLGKYFFSTGAEQAVYDLIEKVGGVDKLDTTDVTFVPSGSNPQKPVGVQVRVSVEAAEKGETPPGGTTRKIFIQPCIMNSGLLDPYDMLAAVYEKVRADRFARVVKIDYGSMSPAELNGLRVANRLPTPSERDGKVDYAAIARDIESAMNAYTTSRYIAEQKISMLAGPDVSNSTTIDRLNAFMEVAKERGVIANIKALNKAMEASGSSIDDAKAKMVMMEMLTVAKPDFRTTPGESAAWWIANGGKQPLAAPFEAWVLGTDSAAFITAAKADGIKKLDNLEKAALDYLCKNTVPNISAVLAQIGD